MQLENPVARISDDASLAIGGSMFVVTSEHMIDERVRQQKRHLTIIANKTAMRDKGTGKLICARLLDRVVASHIGLNAETQQQMLCSELQVELALQADFALVHAFLTGYHGNLTYVLTARNFNPLVAMAGRIVIACADHIVPIGLISPDQGATPAPVVDYLVMHPEA